MTANPTRYGCGRIGSRQDYADMASLAEEFSVDFTKLCSMFEEQSMSVASIRERLGRSAPKTIKTRLPANVGWLTTKQAEALAPGLANAIHVTGLTIDRKLRNDQAHNPQGCGWLYKRADIDRLLMLKRECRLPMTDALRVLDALERLRPEGCDQDEWIVSAEAVGLIPGIMTSINPYPDAIRRKMRREGKPTAHGNGNGWLWHKGDVTRVSDIMSICGVNARIAMRVLTAEKRGKLKV